MDSKYRVYLSPSEKFVKSRIQHYNPEKYWKRRQKVIEEYSSAGPLKKLLYKYYLLYIKRCDAFNNASLGTHLGHGAHFDSVPGFPHGIYGIIISHHARFGKNCCIRHHVTVGGYESAPIIGDNVLIGAGAIVFGDDITIGNNVKIGAGCIVTQNIPDNCTVVMPHPRIIKNEGND